MSDHAFNEMYRSYFTNQQSEQQINQNSQNVQQQSEQQGQNFARRGPSQRVLQAHAFMRGELNDLPVDCFQAYAMSTVSNLISGKFKDEDPAQILNSDPLINADLSRTSSNVVSSQIAKFKEDAINAVNFARQKMAVVSDSFVQIKSNVKDPKELTNLQRITKNSLKQIKNFATFQSVYALKVVKTQSQKPNSEVKRDFKYQNSNPQYQGFAGQAQRKSYKQQYANNYQYKGQRQYQKQNTQSQADRVYIKTSVENSHLAKDLPNSYYYAKYKVWVAPADSLKDASVALVENTKIYAEFGDLVNKGGSLPLPKEIASQMIGPQGKSKQDLNPQITAFRNAMLNQSQIARNEQSMQNTQNNYQEQTQNNSQAYGNRSYDRR